MILSFQNGHKRPNRTQEQFYTVIGQVGEDFQLRDNNLNYYLAKSLVDSKLLGNGVVVKVIWRNNQCYIKEVLY